MKSQIRYHDYEEDKQNNQVKNDPIIDTFLDKRMSIQENSSEEEQIPIGNDQNQESITIKQKKKASNQKKQTKQVKTTKQLKQKPSSSRRRIDDQVKDLLENQFLHDINITLVYQNFNLLSYLVENNDNDIVDKLIIDQFQNLYDNICYKGLYIKKCKQIVEKSLINCILTRNGKMIYEVNSVVQIQHVKIDPFSILNTQIMEINQSHNSRFVLLINKGTEGTNLHIANVFIQLENVSQDAQQIYNQCMQIGQYIPCIAQKMVYHAGQQNITVFATLLQKLNFKHIYLFKQNDPINLELLNDYLHNITLMQSEMNEEGLIRVKQYIELLLNSQLNEKLLQTRLNTHHDIKQIDQYLFQDKQQLPSKNAVSDGLKDHKELFLEMDLINYIYGNFSIINRDQLKSYKKAAIAVNIVEDSHNQSLLSQLINRILKWQLFFIEFISLNSSTKSFSNLSQILSI